MKFKGYRNRLQALLAIFALCMMTVSAYLTVHYYKAQFPTEINTGSFCDISRFWNCDHATFSDMSNIFGIPIALLGTAFGFLILLGVFYRSLEKTNFFLALLNFLGCIVLFIYSILYLGGLCPGCVIYYLFSAGIVLIFFFMRVSPDPNKKILAGYGFFIILLSMATLLYNQSMFRDFEKRLQDFVIHLKNTSTSEENYDLDFSLSLVQSSENFNEAPLRITIFSDFQCPFCSLLSKELHKIISRYKGKLNIRYVFFPLDATCNANVHTSPHPEACKAALLSYCARKNFSSIHDELYDMQNGLSDAWLKEKAKSLDMLACYEDQNSMDKVKSMINVAQKFNITAVPTMIINGKKISGLLSAKVLIAILDGFLDEDQKDSK